MVASHEGPAVAPAPGRSGGNKTRLFIPAAMVGLLMFIAWEYIRTMQTLQSFKNQTEASTFDNTIPVLTRHEDDTAVIQADVKEEQSNMDIGLRPSTATSDEKGRVSRITRYPDAFLIENACFRKSGNENGFIQVFTDVESDLDPFLGKNAPARNLRMHIKWERKPSVEWQKVTSGLNGVYSGADTLMFYENEQPAHCLHDFLFSAYLHQPNGRRFSAYIPRSHPGVPCHPQKKWCCFLFERAGVIDPKKAAPFNADRGLGCYERLWVLIFGVGRYAPDWKVIHSKLHYDVFAHDADTGQFALDHLKNLHHEMLTRDDAVVLRRTSTVRWKRTNILILDRSEARRRVWLNANEFVSMLVTRWKELSTEKLGSVYFLGTRFGELTPLDQARLFYHADVIFSPHGAQLSNMIFGEPKRTALFEFHCTEIPGHENETFVEWSSSDPNLAWFSTFPARLKMRPFFYMQDVPDCKHDIRGMNLSNEKLFELVKQTGVFAEELSME